MQRQPDTIIVVDFGSQYAHLIARRVRELGVHSRIVLPGSPVSAFRDAKGIILSGGPASVYEKNAPRIREGVFRLDIPMLGICYGHQLMAHMLGGIVQPGNVREFGHATLAIRKQQGLFAHLSRKEAVWMSHGDQVTGLPRGFVTLAGTRDCPVTAMGDSERKRYGIQFHPEVTNTPHGSSIIANFIFNIARARKQWTVKNVLLSMEETIRKQAKGKNVFVLLSGGVDSLVTFALLARVLGPKRVRGLHVDTGFMRKGESDLVHTSLTQLFHTDTVRVVRCADRFLGELSGVTDPEQKRHIIGRLFVEIAEEEILKLKLDARHWLLGQGTIYPDTIESGGTRHAAKIKTHHNRVREIEKLMRAGRIIEPLRDLYKDEVRMVGMALGLPRGLVLRHPFPGPGLAIQALCISKPSPATLTAQEQKRVRAILAKTSLHATVLPIRSVGVQGDFRTYAHPLALTRAPGRNIPTWKTLEHMSTTLTNSVRSVNRAILHVAGTHPKNLKAHPATLTLSRLNTLREIHALVTEEMIRAGWAVRVQEMPVVLIPLGEGGKESVVLRPLVTDNFMTLRFAHLPMTLVRRIAHRLVNEHLASAVFFDITNKPPGTVQWE